MPPPGLVESSHLDPTNPYSAAKAGAELIARAYITSYKMPIIITRGNNVYGPHQFPEKLIPKFTLLAARGKELPVHGDGSSVRSYLYVEDVAEAFDCVLHKGVTGRFMATTEELAIPVCRTVKVHCCGTACFRGTWAAPGSGTHSMTKGM